MRPDSVVIVGGGLAAAKTAEHLRADGFDGPITLIGAEEHLPYERPALSKDYLAGKVDADSLAVHDAQWYADHDVDLRLGVAVVQIDRAEREVLLADGSRIGYGALVLATGSRSRHLDLPGAEAEGVLYLRDRGESEALKDALTADRRVVLIGAGWIGLEVAAHARGQGAQVDIVEMAKLPLLAVLGPDLAQDFADLHTEHGVNFHFAATLERIEVEDGRATAVRLGDGTRLPADVVIVGVGAVPNTDLAEAAGLAVDNGVLVDGYLRTSDADIFAVGDIAAQDHPLLGRLRVEHWANALNQPKALARTIVGQDTAYVRQPYFYTDQYDLGMEYRGIVPRGTETQVVTRGDRAAREFLAFWLDANQRVLAAMNVNIWDAGDALAALVGGDPVDSARLADPEVPLADVLPKAP